MTCVETLPNVLSVSVSLPKRFQYITTVINQQQCFANIHMPSSSGEFVKTTQVVGSLGHRRGHDFNKSGKSVEQQMRHALQVHEI